MFVPVACSQCGKPFQVPEAGVGNPTVCPWCRATVPALPVGIPAAAPPAATEENRGLTPPARQEAPAPEPLPLDDEPPEPPAPTPVPPAPAAPPVRRFRWWVAAVGLVALLVAAGATVAVLRYKKGHVLGSEWQEFPAPDGSFRVELLGRAAEDTTTEPGERRYVAEGWYSGITTWVGWRELTAVQRQYALAQDGWVHLRPLFDAERDRLVARHGGTARETTRFDGPAVIHTVRVEYPGGRAVERMIVVADEFSGRVYFVGMAGNFDPDGPEAKRLFESFRLPG